MIFFLWLVIFILLVIVTMVLSLPELVFFAFGTLLAAILSLIPGLENAYLIHLVSALTLALFLFIFIRKQVRSIFQGTELQKDIYEFSGRIGVVVEPISPDRPGRISLGGTTWEALSYSEKFDVGEQVLVLEKNGLTLIVSKIQQEVAWRS